MSVSDRMTVTVAQARSHVLDSFRNQIPIFIWGPSGVGKSDLIRQIASELDAPLYDVRLPLMEPTDLRGIPFYNKDMNKMDWAAPVDLPDASDVASHNTAILFLDELNSAAPQVQASAYQLILDRKVGKYTLPDNVVVVAAGNRESDKGVTYRMPAPLSNRMCHIEVRVDHESWEDWAVKNQIHPDIIGYLGHARQDLHDFKSNSNSVAFPSPRTWSYVSRFLKDKNVDENRLMTTIAGCVGEGAAVKFMAHRKISGGLPRPEKIIDGSIKMMETKEISAMYSMAINLCYYLNELNSKRKSDSSINWNEAADNFFEFMMNNFTTELTVMAAHTALNRFKLPFKSSELKTFNEFHKRFGKYILAAIESN